MGRLHFRYSSMNAGKSTYLLQVAHNYKENGKEVFLLTSSLDTRDGVGVIASRLGLKSEAHLYHPQTDFEDLLSKVDVACVLIDEAQFLTPGQIKQIHRWVHESNTPVLCFGLRSDFKGNPFEGSATLLALADNLEEIRTVCRCGKKATMNMRQDGQGNKILEGDQVLIGGNSTYRQVCAKCFYQS